MDNNTMVTFGTSNRITIPKHITDKLNLTLGTKLQLEVQDNQIILTIPKETDIQKQPIKKSVDTDTQTQKKSNKGTKKIKIVSNLEEGQHFSKKYYSECKLVIRTKNRYLKDFCSVCRGQLVTQQKDLVYRSCPYIKKPTQNIIQKLTDNVNKLNKVIDDKIQDTKKEIVNTENKIKPKLKQKEVSQDILITKLKKYGNKTILPVTYHHGNVSKCKDCGALFSKGFLVNDSFYCKDCTVINFKKYLKLYKKYSKELS